jgi:hypothetical protein
VARRYGLSPHDPRRVKRAAMRIACETATEATHRAMACPAAPRASQVPVGPDGEPTNPERDCLTD